MAKLDAGLAGTFRVAGKIAINRLGFGAMRITGEGIWGEPSDREECKRTLARLPALDVNFVDTADSYGPDVSEEHCRDAPGLVTPDRRAAIEVELPEALGLIPLVDHENGSTDQTRF